MRWQASREVVWRWGVFGQSEDPGLLLLSPCKAVGGVLPSRSSHTREGRPDSVQSPPRTSSHPAALFLLSPKTFLL